MAGLGLSAALAAVHLALLRGDLWGGPVCGAVGTWLNCHAVAASRFSRLLGVPLAFWGVLGYAAAFTLAFIGIRFSLWRAQVLVVLAVLSGAFLLFDAGWLAVMVLRIRYVCSLCLMTYGVNLGILWAARRGTGLSWREIFRRFPESLKPFLPRSGSVPGMLLWTVVLTASAGMACVHVSAELMSRAPGGLRDRMRQRVLTAPRLHVDTEGSPRLGRAGAPVTIVEFTDFRCPLCREATRFNAILLAAHPDEAALVIKHFPVHLGSDRLALAAVCAQEQGKFWPLHDRLFRREGGIRLEDLEFEAAQAGLDPVSFRVCMAGGPARARLQRDIDEAGRIGVAATPTYVVNGILILGEITPAAFEELIQALKERKGESS